MQEPEAYNKMYYKNSNSIGIRRKSDKKQIMSFGGRTTKLTKTAMQKLGDEAIVKLKSGSTVEQVRDWAKQRMKD